MTTPVPSASDSGRLRLGFFTSPAVNVTLFQASAEKSDPTCATARMVRVPDHHHRPADSDLNRMLRAQSGVVPEISEIRSEGLRVTSESEAKEQQVPAAPKPWRAVKMF